MINSEVFIIKRDGKKETFSLDKIKNAIAKAFLSVGSFATQDVITTVLSRVSVSDGMNVEEIQNQVEVALMAEHYYSVAKAYMLYRQKHLEDREVRDKLKFLLDYCDASNPATGSKYDANANVENKNIATLIGELPKSNFIRLNRRLLTDRLKDMYGKELSDRYLELLNHHFIYKNDETNLANYCASITMYPWLNNGTIAVGGNSTAPTNLKSFCGGFVNMVFIVSSMLSSYAFENIDVFCPLCYGDKVYIEDVIKRGKEIFGDKFHYFVDLKSTEEYDDFLHSIDVYVSAAAIQTGLYALMTTMLSGAKAYITGNLYSSMKEYGFIVNDLKTLSDLPFEQFATVLDSESYNHNVNVYSFKYVNVEELQGKWKRIYSE